MMAAACAEGETLLENAAQEPEIADLAAFLNRCGAHIEGAGKDTIRIAGVGKLKGVEYRVMPDRIEASTLMVAGAITKGDITLKGVVEQHVEPVIRKLQDAGVEVTVSGDQIKIKVKDGLKAIDVKTMPYPGFPTDAQPQFTSLDEHCDRHFRHHGNRF